MKAVEFGASQKSGWRNIVITPTIGNRAGFPLVYRDGCGWVATSGASDSNADKQPFGRCNNPSPRLEPGS
jgi:hypothetical protein